MLKVLVLVLVLVPHSSRNVPSIFHNSMPVSTSMLLQQLVANFQLAALLFSHSSAAKLQGFLIPWSMQLQEPQAHNGYLLELSIFIRCTD
jgi:hypothetical protein